MDVGVIVGDGVCVGVFVLVGVAVFVGVEVGVTVIVAVGVFVYVGGMGVFVTRFSLSPPSGGGHALPPVGSLHWAIAVLVCNANAKPTIKKIMNK